MKILYTGTLDVNAGGPAFSTYNTMRGLNNLHAETHVMMYELGEGARLIGDDVPMHFAKKPIDRVFGFAPSLKKEIKACGEFDIYQAQGIWQYNTYAMVDVARSLGKPYLITPRGMLYPQDIAKSKPFFKKLSLKIRLLDDLNRAACVHVTCDDELRHCRDLGVTSPICVVPNPVEIKEYPRRKSDDKFRLGYLGRISRRKNVEGLIYAWAALGEKVKDGELLIIGGGDDEYMAFLQSEVMTLGLQNVRFTGFISGQQKEDALASLSVLAMPSEFENFGNVIVEGLVRGIPCIATKGAPWKDLADNNCGWWVDYSQEAITAAVKSAVETSAEELIAMGERGKMLMKEKYSIEAVATQLKSVYEWILGKAGKPAYVKLLTSVRGGVIWIVSLERKGTTNLRLFGEGKVRPRKARNERIFFVHRRGHLKLLALPLVPLVPWSKNNKASWSSQHQGVSLPSTFRLDSADKDSWIVSLEWSGTTNHTNLTNLRLFGVGEVRPRKARNERKIFTYHKALALPCIPCVPWSKENKTPWSREAERRAA